VANGEFRVFISAVTSEFGPARDDIAADLGARAIHVRVQRSFRQEEDADTLLRKLHNYIRDCNAVICVIGKRSGACAQVAEAAEFTDMLPPGFDKASYTQWEFFFARHYRKRLSIYLATKDFVPYQGEPTTEDYPDLQQKLIEHITLSGLDRNDFSNAEQLRIGVLKEDWPTTVGHRPVKLPYPTMRGLFKGRSDLMQQLGASLSVRRGTTIIARALYGLGGIGKTRAAVEYAWQHQNQYSALLLVVAETAQTLRRDLAALTAWLGLPERNSPDDELKLGATLKWLRDHPLWLLILDGLDNERALDEAAELIGQMTGGHIVITSQLSNFPAYVEPSQLDVINVEEAMRFLIERTKRRRRSEPDAEGEARELASDLGQLALALEQAAAFINERQLTFAQYRKELHDNWLSVAGWSKPAVTNYPRALAATWQTSVARLSEPTRRTLHRLAWFSSEPIPEFILDVAVNDRAKSLWDSLHELSSLSLVMRRMESSFFSVHRLVQQATRLKLEADHPGEHRQSLEEALNWIEAAFTGDPANVENWPRLDALWSHALAAAQHAEPYHIAAGVRLGNAVAGLRTAKAAHAQRAIERGYSPDVWSPLMTELRIRHTKFEKALEPLRTLKSLEELALPGINVGDPAPLTAWVNLQRLDLGRSKVISVAPLAELKALRKLDLHRTKISDVGPLGNLKHLESLSLAHTMVSNISDLANLNALRFLDLSDTPLKSISKLPVSLTHLKLGGTRVRDASPVAALTNLRSIDLSDTRVTDLTPLAQLRKLEEIRLSGARVHNLLPLAGLRGLRELNLSGTSVKVISKLSGLINLRVLSLGGCAVEDISALAELIDLQVLNLGCTRVEDLAPLAGLINLYSLDLRGTRVRDLRSIAELPDLYALDIAYSEVLEVSPLKALPRLQILHLEGTNVTDTANLSGKGLRILREV
jgi:Leucine-rich repeat (LRR) protein